MCSAGMKQYGGRAQDVEIETALTIAIAKFVCSDGCIFVSASKNNDPSDWTLFTLLLPFVLHC